MELRSDLHNVGLVESCHMGNDDWETAIVQQSTMLSQTTRVREKQCMNVPSVAICSTLTCFSNKGLNEPNNDTGNRTEMTE